MPIKIIIGLIIAITIAAIFALLAFPAILGTEDAAGCTGFLRNIGSILADVSDISLC